MSDDLTFGVKLGGDSSTMVSETKAAAAEIDNLKKSTDDLAAASAQLASQHRATAEETLQYWTGMSTAESNAKDLAWALANGYQQSGGVMVKTAEEVAGGMDKTAFATHRAYSEMVVLAREAARGNFSRMAGSATVLLQGLSPLALGIAGVTAAIAAAGYAWWEFAKDATDADHSVADVFAEDSAKITQKLQDQTELLKQRAALAAQGIVGQDDTATQDITAMHVKILGLAEDIKSGTLDWNAQIIAVQELTKTTTDYNNLVNAQAAKQAAEKDLKDVTHQKTGDGAKLLAQAQQLDDQMTAVHEDTFTKWIEKWKAMEDKLVAAHLYGTKEREQHEAAYTSFVNAESAKREKAAADAQAKKDAHLQAQLTSEQKYFSQLSAEANDFGKNEAARENKRYHDQVIQFQHRYDLARQDHTLSLAEEQGFQDALANIITIHQETQLQQDGVVGQMMLAMKQNDHEMEITSTLGFLTSLSALNAGHSRTMFELNKESATASAIVNTYLAASKVFADVGGGPWGAAAAAATIIMGMAQVSAIQSTKFGGGGMAAGGGGVPSMATSPGLPVANVQTNTSAPNSSAAPAAPVQATQQLNYTIIGAKANPDQAVVSFNTAVAMMAAINEAGARGHKINATVIAA